MKFHAPHLALGLREELDAPLRRAEAAGSVASFSNADQTLCWRCIYVLQAL